MDSFHWTVADWLQASNICVTICSIIVTAWVAIWVVQSLQKKIDTESTLRNHFAQEVIQLRTDTREYIQNLLSKKEYSVVIKRNHFQFQKRVNDLLNLLNEKYDIDNINSLKAYRTELSSIIDRDINYIKKYNISQKIHLTDETKKQISKLHADNDHIFNEILLKIYEDK